jgi:exodeoxyribonuclease-5
MLATMAREARPIPAGVYGDSAVIARKDLPIEKAVEFDQIIVGRNETRRAINNRVRAHLGFPAGRPVAGDRLVCLRNDYETGLLNGSQWKCVGAEELDSERVLLSILGDDGTGLQVEAHAAYFRGEEPPFYDIRDAQCFDFAYAITCHKSQGSQFRSVCVVDEAAAFQAEAHRWRYTAITRASERITIIR